MTEQMNYSTYGRRRHRRDDRTTNGGGSSTLRPRHDQRRATNKNGNGNKDIGGETSGSLRRKNSGRMDPQETRQSPGGRSGNASRSPARSRSRSRSGLRGADPPPSSSVDGSSSSRRRQETQRQQQHSRQPQRQRSGRRYTQTDEGTTTSSSTVRRPRSSSRDTSRSRSPYHSSSVSGSRTTVSRSAASRSPASTSIMSPSRSSVSSRSRSPHSKHSNGAASRSSMSSRSRSPHSNNSNSVGIQLTRSKSWDGRTKHYDKNQLHQSSSPSKNQRRLSAKEPSSSPLKLLQQLQGFDLCTSNASLAASGGKSVGGRSVTSEGAGGGKFGSRGSSRGRGLFCRRRSRGRSKVGNTNSNSSNNKEGKKVGRRSKSLTNLYRHHKTKGIKSNNKNLKPEKDAKEGKKSNRGFVRDKMLPLLPVLTGSSCKKLTQKHANMKRLGSGEISQDSSSQGTHVTKASRGSRGSSSKNSKKTGATYFSEDDMSRYSSDEEDGDWVEGKGGEGRERRFIKEDGTVITKEGEEGPGRKKEENVGFIHFLDDSDDDDDEESDDESCTDGEDMSVSPRDSEGYESQDSYSNEGSESFRSHISYRSNNDEDDDREESSYCSEEEEEDGTDLESYISGEETMQSSIRNSIQNDASSTSNTSNRDSSIDNSNNNNRSRAIIEPRTKNQNQLATTTRSSSSKHQSQLVRLLDENETLRANVVSLRHDFEDMLRQITTHSSHSSSADADADADADPGDDGDSIQSDDGSRVSHCIERIRHVKDLAMERLQEKKRRRRSKQMEDDDEDEEEEDDLDRRREDAQERIEELVCDNKRLYRKVAALTQEREEILQEVHDLRCTTTTTNTNSSNLERHAAKLLADEDVATSHAETMENIASLLQGMGNLMEDAKREEEDGGGGDHGGKNNNATERKEKAERADIMGKEILNLVSKIMVSRTGVVPSKELPERGGNNEETLEEGKNAGKGEKTASKLQNEPKSKTSSSRRNRQPAEVSHNHNSQSFSVCSIAPKRMGKEENYTDSNLYIVDTRNDNNVSSNSLFDGTSPSVVDSKGRGVDKKCSEDDEDDDDDEESTLEIIYEYHDSDSDEGENLRRRRTTRRKRQSCSTVSSRDHEYDDESDDDSAYDSYDDVYSSYLVIEDDCSESEEEEEEDDYYPEEDVEEPPSGYHRYSPNSSRRSHSGSSSRSRSGRWRFPSLPGRSSSRHSSSRHSVSRRSSLSSKNSSRSPSRRSRSSRSSNSHSRDSRRHSTRTSSGRPRSPESRSRSSSRNSSSSGNRRYSHRRSQCSSYAPSIDEDEHSAIESDGDESSSTLEYASRHGNEVQDEQDELLADAIDSRLNSTLLMKQSGGSTGTPSTNGTSFVESLSETCPSLGSDSTKERKGICITVVSRSSRFASFPSSVTHTYATFFRAGLVKSQVDAVLDEQCQEESRVSQQQQQQQQKKKKYQGEYNDEGKRHGYGIYTSRNGNEYRGEWQNDRREGLGVVKIGNGDIFEGQFENNLKNGIGVYHFHDGECDLSQYKEDVRCGDCVRYSKDRTRAFLLSEDSRSRAISLEEAARVAKEMGTIVAY